MEESTRISATSLAEADEGRPTRRATRLLLRMTHGLALVLLAPVVAILWAQTRLSTNFFPDELIDEHKPKLTLRAIDEAANADYQSAVFRPPALPLVQPGGIPDTFSTDIMAEMKRLRTD